MGGVLAVGLFALIAAGGLCFDSAVPAIFRFEIGNVYVVRDIGFYDSCLRGRYGLP